ARETEGDDAEVRVDLAELGQDRRSDRLPTPGRDGHMRLARCELAEGHPHRGAHVVQRAEAVLAVRVLVGPGHYLGVEAHPAGEDGVVARLHRSVTDRDGGDTDRQW